jgi:hypothetical protein
MSVVPEGTLAACGALPSTGFGARTVSGVIRASRRAEPGAGLLSLVPRSGTSLNGNYFPGLAAMKLHTPDVNPG